MLFGCSMESTGTIKRLHDFPKVTLCLIAIAIATRVHSLGPP